MAEEVLKNCNIPLVLVRDGGRCSTPVRNVLVPVDGSPGAAVALQTAVDVAQVTGASIRVVRVVEPIPVQAFAAPYDVAGAPFYDPAWDDDALASARAYVDAVAARLRAAGLSVEVEVRLARDVAEAIVEVAEQASLDMIVMSTQALTGPARALLGSVADAVVRTAPCPVLLVHRAEGPHATPDSTTLNRGIAAAT